ncbi:solute carrier 7, member 6 opposite strand [Apophysomyces sp. BC1034]|nr:solute carrier 7, member 6 opposite strand [Apophysomyces sp. BC1015]KAG0177114.1 solute carrier 7, member 6 opposite strand [Apophysomyces sp. BC1021]KAG0187410.1 solute carrier 7, member 6 opposite strand [Apophysomyces sp. BC1034]
MQSTQPVKGKSDEANGSSQLTILRIKRKRNEEPLDALLVHQDQERHAEKRSRKDNNTKQSSQSIPTVSATNLPKLFRLAETVEENSFKNIAEAQKLKERITRRIQPGSRPRTPDLNERKDRMMQQQLKTTRQARYRVINQNRAKTSNNLPPVVQSASDKAAEDLFQMYEAVKEDEKKQPKLFMDEGMDDPDDIMCNFIPMVKEYLTLNETQEETEESDYVYDVYYRDDSNNTAEIHSGNIGSLVWFENESEYVNDDEDSELGDHEDEDSNAEDYYQNDYPDEESDQDYEDQYGYELSSEDEDYQL